MEHYFMTLKLWSHLHKTIPISHNLKVLAFNLCKSEDNTLPEDDRKAEDEF